MVATKTRQKVPEGAQERWLTVHGGRMRYLEAGTGPPLLLVHGLMGYSFSWSEVIPELARSFHVLAPDLLNTGLSDRCDIRGDLRECAAQLVSLLESLGIAGTDVIASSYGGAVAMRLACDRPDLVRRLVLTSPAHPASESGRWQIRLFSTWCGGWLGMGLYLLPDLVLGLGLKHRLYGRKSVVRPGTIAGYARALQTRGTIEALARQVRGWKTDFAALRDDLARVHHPLLLLWGDEDRIVGPHTMEGLKALMPHADTALMRGVGHVPYEEQPEEFLEIVRPWLLSQK